MRLAVLIGLSPDRRSALVFGDVRPADEVSADFRAGLDKGPIDARFPVMGVAELRVVKEHKFRVTDDEVCQAEELANIPDELSLSSLIEVNDQLQARNSELEAQLQALLNQVEEAGRPVATTVDDVATSPQLDIIPADAPILSSEFEPVATTSELKLDAKPEEPKASKKKK